MTTEGTLNEIIRIINEYSVKLNAGTLNKEELEDFVAHTRDLNEHAVVLRYKAYEKQVFGDEPVEEVSNSITTEEPIEAQASSVDIPVIEQELPLFEIPFDLSEPEVLPVADLSRTEVSWDVNKTEQPVTEHEPLDEMPSNPANDDHVETPELVMETIELEQPDAAVEESDDSTSSVESAEEAVAEDNVYEEAGTSEHVEVHYTEEEVAVESHNEQVITEAPADIQTSIKFIQKFRETPLDMVVQLRMTKLDRLAGSFGLNERIQFINELFKGSGDDFSNAISELDSLTDIDNALMRTSVFSADFKWDIESNTVNDFVWKLKRRYA